MTLLLLAGTGEARVIAQHLAERSHPAIASIAGATRTPAPLALPTRTGGFGGREGFSCFLEENGIYSILDATHPFAHRISTRTSEMAAEHGVPYAQFLRAPWHPQTGDRWTALETEADAADHIDPGATVFLATGRQTLDHFANLSNCRLICRQIDPPERPFPFPNGEFLVGRPPFSVEDEMKLFQRLGIDWLIVKNAGGAASRTKLDAARHLGIPVAMIKRPPRLPVQTFDRVERAVEWALSQ
jgi:precorrin-6A/cobalt-precorrin-6A reductase